MIDKIAEEEGISMNTIQSKALLGMGTTLTNFSNACFYG